MPLIIQCDEARPSCEYCSSTNRICVYKDSDSPQSDVNSQLPEGRLRSYCHLGTKAGSAAAAAQNGVITETIDVSCQPYNSLTSHLQVSLFELKLLKFFHAACIPLFTFGLDVKAHQRWETFLPHYFVTSPSVRNAVFSLSCLMLWPRVNYHECLGSDKVATFLERNRPEHDLSHIDKPIGEGSMPEYSLQTLTLSYFDKQIVETRDYVGSLLARGEYSTTDVDPLFFNGLIVYVYLGLSPNIVMPFFDALSEYPMDLLEYSVNHTDILRRVEDQHEHVPYLGKDCLESKVLSYRNYHREGRSNFVTELRNILFDFYYGDTQFLEITSQTCFEYSVLEEHMNMLEYTIMKARKERLPLPIFEFPFMISRDFVSLARLRNPIALKILFAYSGLALYFGFYMDKTRNIWAHYAEWYSRHVDFLCSFDARLMDLIKKPQGFRDYRAYDFDSFEGIWGIKNSEACESSCSDPNPSLFADLSLFDTLDT